VELRRDFNRRGRKGKPFPSLEFLAAWREELSPFKRFKLFQPFKPPPLSSPASRGRMKEGELN